MLLNVLLCNIGNKNVILRMCLQRGLLLKHLWQVLLSIQLNDVDSWDLQLFISPLGMTLIYLAAAGIFYGILPSPCKTDGFE